MRNQQFKDYVQSQSSSARAREQQEQEANPGMQSQGSEDVLSGEGVPSAAENDAQAGYLLQARSQVALPQKMDLESTMRSTALEKREAARQRLMQTQPARHSPDDRVDAGADTPWTTWKGVNVQRSLNQEAQSHRLQHRVDRPRAQYDLENEGFADQAQGQQPEQAATDVKQVEATQRQEAATKPTVRGVFDKFKGRDGQQQRKGDPYEKLKTVSHPAQAKKQGAYLQTFRVVVGPDRMPRPNGGQDDGAGATEPHSAATDAHRRTGQSSVKISRSNHYQLRSGAQQKSGPHSQCSRCSNADIGHVFQTKTGKPRQGSGAPGQAQPGGIGLPNSGEPSQHGSHCNPTAPARLRLQAGCHAASSARTSREAGPAPTVNTIRLVHLTKDPRIDPRSTDWHSTPHQIGSPKFQHAGTVSAKAPEPKNAKTIAHNNERRSQFKGLGLLVKRQPSLREKQCPTPTKSGLPSGAKRAEPAIPLFQSQDAQLSIANASQNVADRVVMVSSQHHHTSSENQTWNVPPESQHSLEQVQLALEESNHNLERFLARAGHVKMDLGTLMAGYSEYLAHKGKVAQGANKQCQEYQSQLHEFLNFKQDIMQRSLKDRLEVGLGEETGPFSPKVPTVLLGDATAAAHLNGSHSLEPTRRGLQLGDQTSPAIDLLYSGKTGKGGAPTTGGRFAKIQRTRASLEQAALPRYPETVKSAKRPGKQATGTTRAIKQGPKETRHQAQGLQQGPKQVRLSDFAGCLKDKDLEIISKITNADGLKALAKQNKNSMPSAASSTMRSGAAPASLPRGVRRGTACAGQASSAVAPEERDLLTDISNAMLQHQLWRQLQASEQAGAGSHTVSPKNKTTSAIGGPGAYSPFHSAEKAGPLPNTAMASTTAQGWAAAGAQPKSDKKFVVQVPQTNLTDSHLGRKAALHQPVLPSAASKRTEGRTDTGVRVNSKFAERPANKNSYSPNDTLQSQNAATSPNVPQTRRKRHSNFDETLVSCTTPNSHDTQYAPHFLSKVRSTGSRQQSIKQSRALEKRAVAQNITIDRILSSPDTYDRTDQLHAVHGGTYQEGYGSGPGARPKGTLSRDALKMTRKEMSLDKAASRTNFSGQSFARQQLLQLCRQSNSEQRENLQGMERAQALEDQKSQKNSLLTPSQSFGAKQDRSPLKNERIAKLSHNTSTKSLNQVERDPCARTLDKKILERSQENSQESAERRNDEDAVRRHPTLPITGGEGEQTPEDLAPARDLPAGVLDINTDEVVAADLGAAHQIGTPAAAWRGSRPLSHESGQKQAAEEAQRIVEGHELKPGGPDTSVVHQPASGGHAAEPAPMDALHVLSDATQSAIGRHRANEPQSAPGSPRYRQREEPRSDEGKFKEGGGLPFSLDLLPTLDVITISPQTADKRNRPEHARPDGLFDHEALMGYRARVPHNDFPGHCHGPILSSRGGIMSQEVADKETYEVRSNNQALEMPRVGEGGIAPLELLHSQNKLRVERGSTAGASVRKGRELGHRRFYQSLVGDNSRLSGLQDRLEINDSARGQHPSGLNQTTIAVNDPASAAFMNTGQALYSLKNSRKRPRDCSKEAKPLAPADLSRRVGKSTPRVLGLSHGAARASQADWTKEPLLQQITETEKQQMRLERYRQRKNHVELERLRRARMAQNRCLQRQRVQEKNKSLRIEAEAAYPAQALQLHGPIPLRELRERDRLLARAKAPDLTPRLRLAGCPVGDQALTATNSHEYAKPRGFLPLPPKSCKNQMLQADEQKSLRALLLHEQPSARRNPGTDLDRRHDMLISPQITYQKIVPPTAAAAQRLAPDFQPVLRVQLAQQPLPDRAPPDTVRRTGTLDIATADDLFV